MMEIQELELADSARGMEEMVLEENRMAIMCAEETKGEIVLNDLQETGGGGGL